MIRVLIVDDDPDVASVLNDAVTGFGHRTAVVLSGALALRAAREFVPHVVLLDIRMPGVDGHTLLEHLKRSPQPPAIIIVSGNADEEEARQLLQRGAFDYVTKPVSLNYLEQAIAAAAGTELS
jgi:CheY-like chemotaxis protein